MTTNTVRLLSKKNNLEDMIIDQSPSRDLLEGEVRLKLDQFALTTNNISYAAFGDSIGYWKVFPVGVDGYGHMPVWGYADIIETTLDRVPATGRVWGFFPMANELIVRPGAITKYSFVDMFEHRNAVPAVYNRYTFCHTNPYYRSELESFESLFRPLFITSYTTAEFLRDKAFFSAKCLLVSSASSKTAYGIAWCLRAQGLPVIGLTSTRNLDFVRGLGVYDRVFSYSEIQALDPKLPTLYIDLANDDGLRSQIYEHFKGAFVYHCLVGSTQADSFSVDQALRGPPPIFFFAAEYLDLQRKNGTIRNFYSRFEEDQLAFFKHTSNQKNPWIKITKSEGLNAAIGVAQDLINGQSDPSRGHTIRLT